MRKLSDHSIFIIFGATGNLARTKLLPALFELDKSDLLPLETRIIGVGRKDFKTQDYFNSVKQDLIGYSRSSWTNGLLEKFQKRIEFCKIDFNNLEDFSELTQLINRFEKETKQCLTRIFYLATAPSFFPKILQALKEQNLHLGCSIHGKKSRIVIEKPFGKDLETARRLNMMLDGVFSEEQIYRIDHYLAKEAVQNILAFRFANEIFDPILNKKYVDNIQIVQSEDAGIGDRGEYYEEAGALRDMVQNHLLQLTAITTMARPKTFDAVSIREEKVKLLREIKTIDPKDVGKFVVLGQYTAGLLHRKKVAAYREEAEVARDSKVETFVAMKILINNRNWFGVPVYIKHGKRLERKLTTITFVFKEAEHGLFDNLSHKVSPNLLTFQIQPDEGISIKLAAKKPDLSFNLTDVDMEFCYSQSFKMPLPDAYERLLLDIMNGDQTLFPHVDEVIRSWEIVDNILKGWKEMYSEPFPYRAGSWGPKEADKLIQDDGRKWFAHGLTICRLH